MAIICEGSTAGDIDQTREGLSVYSDKILTILQSGHREVEQMFNLYKAVPSGSMDAFVMALIFSMVAAKKRHS